MMCSSCGHDHTGSMWAFICIGCSCEERPGKPPPSDVAVTVGIPTDSPEGQEILYAMLRAQPAEPMIGDDDPREEPQ